jgi:hypothetical protein
MNDDLIDLSASPSDPDEHWKYAAAEVLAVYADESGNVGAGVNPLVIADETEARRVISHAIGFEFKEGEHQAVNAGDLIHLWKALSLPLLQKITDLEYQAAKAKTVCEQDLRAYAKLDERNALLFECLSSFLGGQFPAELADKIAVAIAQDDPSIAFNSLRLEQVFKNKPKTRTREYPSSFRERDAWNECCEAWEAFVAPVMAEFGIGQEKLERALKFKPDAERFRHLIFMHVDRVKNGKDDDAAMLTFGPFESNRLRVAIDKDMASSAVGPVGVSQDSWQKALALLCSDDDGIETLTRIAEHALAAILEKGASAVSLKGLAGRNPHPMQLATLVRATNTWRAAIPGWDEALALAERLFVARGEDPADALFGLFKSGGS